MEARHHKRPDDADVHFIAQQFSLFDPDGARQLIESLEDIPRPVGFVAIDTAASHPARRREFDMGQFMANLPRVADTGPTVLSVIT